MAEISLTNGAVAFVDDADLSLVSQWKWRLKTNRKLQYAVRGSDNKLAKGEIRRMYMHRLILNASPGEEVDHRDGDGLNNRKENLRFCSHKQNLWNGRKQLFRRGKRTTSVYKGVCLHRERWLVQITINGRPKFIGYFDKEEVAALAYDAVAKETYGEFARLNF